MAKRVRRCSIRLCSIVCPALYCLFIHTEASVHWFYFEKSQENSCGGFSFLIKSQTTAHVFSCEFCAIKNIYFVGKLRTAACEHRVFIFFFALILRQNRYLPLNSVNYSVSNVRCYGVRANPVKFPISDLVMFFIFYHQNQILSETSHVQQTLGKARES